MGSDAVLAPLTRHSKDDCSDDRVGQPIDRLSSDGHHKKHSNELEPQGAQPRTGAAQMTQPGPRGSPDPRVTGISTSAAR